MEGLFSVTWIVPVPPFLAFLAIILFLNSNKRGSALIAIGSAVISFLLGWGIAFASFFPRSFRRTPH